MSTLTIEDFSPALYAELERIAVHNHRSITQQASVFLENCLKEYFPANTRKVPSNQARELPEPIDVGVKLDSEWIYNAIREGRK